MKITINDYSFENFTSRTRIALRFDQIPPEVQLFSSILQNSSFELT